MFFWTSGRVRESSTWAYARLDLLEAWPLMAVYLLIFIVAVARRNRHKRASTLAAGAGAIGFIWLCGLPVGRYVAPEVFRFFAYSLDVVLCASIALIGLAVFVDRSKTSTPTPE